MGAMGWMETARAETGRRFRAAGKNGGRDPGYMVLMSHMQQCQVCTAARRAGVLQSKGQGHNRQRRSHQHLQGDGSQAGGAPRERHSRTRHQAPEMPTRDHHAEEDGQERWKGNGDYVASPPCPAKQLIDLLLALHYKTWTTSHDAYPQTWKDEKGFVAGCR